ncbi:hypothetical protein [Paenisporosarcina sp. TG-14]|uniref:hypothetical protein n=1 Tax=Paenisporosarcina sp. TG-14 TaxID=1231057 RepID=UPI0002EEB4CB|nr:hypothetical protein [Paenisporosarcina sp. TG-14]
MWKKTMIGLGLSALVLSGCNNDIPGGDETPMEDTRDETRDVVPDTSPTTEDQNLDEDKDMTKDRNTPEEEILEDDMDARDADDMDR